MTSDHRVDLPLPLPSPQRLAPRQWGWYEAQTPDVQEAIRRLAVEVEAHGGGDSDAAFGALIDLTMAFRADL